MGFEELVLVQPRDMKVLNRKRTKEAASGALNVLDGAIVVENLEQALEGTTVHCATGMPNDMSIIRDIERFQEPRPYMEDLVNKNGEIQGGVSFVFGSERFGMTKEDMELCQIVLGIPTNPLFGSLNLASAVQLIAYDWRQALGGFKTQE